MTTRFSIGMTKLKEIEGDAADEALAVLEEVSPELARYCVEFPMCDIYSRPQLDLRTRELATIAGLTVLGNAPLQLKIHVKAALRVGCTEVEIKEAILHMTIVSGFPAAINAMLLAKEVFDELKEIK